MSDKDLFRRRMEMADTLIKLPPEVMENIDLAEWYPDFWKVVGLHYHRTKFSAEEKDICRQILDVASREKNPIRRQYFALTFLLFGEFQEFSKLVNQSYWSAQLRKDFAAFVNWDALINSPLTAQARIIILHNRQISAFLQEKYSALIQKHSQAVINDKTCPRVPPKKYRIYYCWLQGEENLPPIVRCCYNSLKQNAGRYKIVFIDEKNFSNYVDIAPHIIEKFRAGKISRTHFSDVLRVNLLERYGGFWLDATILVTEPLENHKDFWQADYFTQKFLHAVDYPNPYNKMLNWCVSYGRWTVGIQGSSILHNPLFAFERDFYNEYWRDFDAVIDYNLMDFMMDLAYKNIPAVKKEIDAVPINNTKFWTLYNHYGDAYEEFPYDKLLNGTFLSKLDWRFSSDVAVGSVLEEIQRRYE